MCPLGSVFLSFFPKNQSGWVYRIFDRRSVSVKGINNEVRKIAVVDLSTNLPFGIDVPSEVKMEELEVEKAYFASLKVYTAQKTENVPKEFVEFFNVLDVDQSIEDFIKAYWLYPKLIRFELVEAEPL